MNTDQLARLIETGDFPGKSAHRKLIETHISQVILTEEFAFKLKKNIKYPFLDFSTLENRKHFCERELTLNQRLAPAMYLGVLPIREVGGQLRIGKGKGKVIDYAVWMKRMQVPKQMHLMLQKGKVTELHMGRLSKVISRFHLGANIHYPTFDLVESQEQFNDLLQVKDFVHKNLGEAYADKISFAIQSSDNYLRNNQAILADRIKKGFTRDVHGDLHARNIFLYRDPVIFDCIEFNDTFRQIDLLNEVAFFCMDLEAHGRHDLSKVFLEKYFNAMAALPDLAHPQLFHYYKSYRANVRAKVNALRAMQATGKEQQSWLAETARYLELMEGYVIP